nr:MULTISPECIES: fatty-acid--CoA ligase [Mycobacterium]
MRSPNGAGAPGCGRVENGPELHSLVLAADYRINDVDRMWSLIKEGRSPLVALGAHHVVMYHSIWEPGRVLVTMGIRHRESVQELLRSPAVFEWFDLIGVSDLPAIFAGEVLEKIDLTASATDTVPAGVIVGAVSTVDDVAELMVKVHGGLDRFRDAGVRKVWLYRALDDGQEVMTLLEIDSLASAQRWIDHPDAAAEWMSGAGIGAYPSLFVGKLAHVMSTEVAR